MACSMCSSVMIYSAVPAATELNIIYNMPAREGGVWWRQEDVIVM